MYKEMDEEDEEQYVEELIFNILYITEDKIEKICKLMQINEEEEIKEIIDTIEILKKSIIEKEKHKIDIVTDIVKKAKEILKEPKYLKIMEKHTKKYYNMKQSEIDKIDEIYKILKPPLKGGSKKKVKTRKRNVKTRKRKVKTRKRKIHGGDNDDHIDGLKINILIAIIFALIIIINNYLTYENMLTFPSVVIYFIFIVCVCLMRRIRYYGEIRSRYSADLRRRFDYNLRLFTLHNEVVANFEQQRQQFVHDDDDVQEGVNDAPPTVDNIVGASFPDETIGEECSICLNGLLRVFTINFTRNLISLPCTHTFHTNCINKMLAKGGQTCPNCRAQLV
jgi:hypothetical protein